MSNPFYPSPSSDLQPARPLQVGAFPRGPIQVQQRPAHKGVVVGESVHGGELPLEEAAVEEARPL